jgi:hypothetical protein
MARQHTEERSQAAGVVAACVFDGGLPEPLRARLAQGAMPLRLPVAVAAAVGHVAGVAQGVEEGPPSGAGALATWAWWHACLTGADGQALGPERVQAVAAAVLRLLGPAPAAGEAMRAGIARLAGQAAGQPHE